MNSVLQTPDSLETEILAAKAYFAFHGKPYNVGALIDLYPRAIRLGDFVWGAGDWYGNKVGWSEAFAIPYGFRELQKPPYLESANRWDFFPIIQSYTGKVIGFMAPLDLVVGLNKQNL